MIPVCTQQIYIDVILVGLLCGAMSLMLFAVRKRIFKRTWIIVLLIPLSIFLLYSVRIEYDSCGSGSLSSGLHFGELKLLPKHLLPFGSYPEPKNENAGSYLEAGTVKFEGIITDVHNGCWADGICSIEIDGRWWIPIIRGGLMPPDSEPEIQGEVVGIVFNEDNESLWKKVEVYAKKTDENSLTIFGDEKYYVRVIGE